MSVAETPDSMFDGFDADGEPYEQVVPDLVDAMLAEAGAAFDRWGDYRSTHEAFGVATEEMAEWLREIHANDEAGARREALQVAAVAFRFALRGWKR